MIDHNETAAILYPTMVQNISPGPPVETKPTTDTAAPKPGEHIAADAAATKTTLTEQKPDVSYVLALPDDALIDAGAIERTATFAKAAGLSPEAAQKALEHANGEVAAYRDQQTDAWTTLTRETWVNDVKSDPEIGGEKYTGAVADAKRFLREFGDPETRQFLDDTGFGNHKAVIRLFARAEKGMANHRRLTGGAGGAVEHKTVAQKTYPYMNP
jgi:hypothetical protein